MAKDYYEILGVSKTATADEIKKAYRKMAMEHHPDRNGGAEAEKKFKEANEAYQVLSDPQKRQQYDQFGQTDFSGNGAGGFSGFSGFEGFDFGGSGFGFGGGLGDIFESFFGQAMSQVQVEVEITPAQAVLGEKIQLNIEGEKIELDIPAGISDGQQFRIPGKGRKHKNGRGDLIISIRIKMPHRISREERELWEKLRAEETKKHGWFR